MSPQRYIKLGMIMDNHADGNPVKWKALRDVLDDCGARAISSDDTDVDLSVRNKSKTVRRVKKPWISRNVTAIWHATEDRDLQVKTLRARADLANIADSSNITNVTIRERLALQEDDIPITKKYLKDNVQRGLPINYYDAYFYSRVPAHIRAYLGAKTVKPTPDIVL